VKSINPPVIGSGKRGVVDVAVTVPSGAVR
jgi:hypothetical protein